MWGRGQSGCGPGTETGRRVKRREVPPPRPRAGRSSDQDAWSRRTWFWGRLGVGNVGSKHFPQSWTVWASRASLSKKISMPKTNSQFPSPLSKPTKLNTRRRLVRRGEKAGVAVSSSSPRAPPNSWWAGRGQAAGRPLQSHSLQGQCPSSRRTCSLAFQCKDTLPKSRSCVGPRDKCEPSPGHLTFGVALQLSEQEETKQDRLWNEVSLVKREW